MSSRRVTWAVVLGFCFYFSLLTAIEVYTMMFAHHHSFARIAVYQLVIWLFWIAATPLVAWLGRTLSLRPLHIVAHTAVALTLAAGHGAWWTAAMMWMQPFDTRNAKTWQQAAQEVMGGALFSRIPMELLIYAGILAASLAIETYAQHSRLETSLAKARLHALELQIQPHFLFNTLNTISGLVRTRRNDEAVEMVAGLSDLLRYTLDHAGEERVPLEQEVAILRRYLEIQQLRFSDRLTIAIDVEDAAKRAAVPTLILQPLAENAVRHGIATSAGAGRIEVKAFRDDASLRVEMFNTGTLGAAREDGIGLTNTESRLRQLYGDAQRLDVRNERGGVVASLSIPWSVLP